MQVLVDGFSEFLEGKIKQINGLKKKGSIIDTLEERVDLLLLCMAKIERSMNELMVFKESTKDYDLDGLIKYDFDLSEYAERFFVQVDKVRDLITKNIGHPAVKMISMKKKEMLLQLLKI